MHQEVTKKYQQKVAISVNLITLCFPSTV